MRRILVLTGMLAVLILAIYGGPAAVSASQTCKATCSGGETLTCMVANGTCTSSGATVTCCGQTHDCNAIVAFDTCLGNCFTTRNACVNRCGFVQSCTANCDTNFNACRARCGSTPPTSFSC